MSARVSLLAALLATSLSATGACAAEGGAGGPAGRLNLFVSPSGEPFRGRPGEPYPSAAWFARTDADHDGRLTAAEFRADAEAFFGKLDTNHDRVVDGFETQDYERTMPEMTPQIRPLRAGEGQDPNLGRRGGGRRFDDGGGGGRRGRSRGGGREGVGLFSWFYDPEPVTAADADFNSRITLAEADAVADKRFAQLDAMRLGYLTLASLPKTTVQALAEAREKDRAKDRRRNRDGRGVEPEPGRERLHANGE
jgi:hypothetical protein